MKSRSAPIGNVSGKPSPKPSKDKDLRVSVCSECRYGIFTFHEFIWTDRGLVHTDCNTKRNDESEISA